MKRLIVDMSPIMYGCLFSVSKEDKNKPRVDGVVPFTHKSELIYLIISELTQLKHQFNTEEVILAFDNSKGGYWRKDYYDRYKYGRKKSRDDSFIDWDAAMKIFNELKDVLQKGASFKVLDVPRMEADDIAFVLSEYFKNDAETILYTIDHDWEHNLIFDNVKVFKTRRTQKKDGCFVTKTKEELEHFKLEHIIAGDKGDGFLHIKSWTQFSDDFLNEYPKFKGKEQELYDKHHLIERKFDEKHDFKKSAYKHPRFGYKSFSKSSKTIEDILNENPIHRKNYERNKKLCLPSGIPQKYKDAIIESYKQASDERNPGILQNFFMQNNLFDLTSSIPLL